MTSAWTSLVNVLLGFWLISAPYTFGYQSRAMLYSDWISGLLIILFALLSRSGKRVYAPWLGAFVAIWVQAAPLLFWAKESASYLNNTLVGALMMVFFIIIPNPPGGEPDEGPSVAPGWSYNPSSWAQRIPILAFAAICWFASRLLAAFQLGYIDEITDPFFDSGTREVLTSKISQWFPVSDAGLGTFAYALEFLFACQGGERRWRTSPWMGILSGTLIVPVSLVSVVLIILQPIAVGSWCSICLFTAFCALLTVPLGIDELVLTLQYMRKSKEKPFWKLLFQGGSCPGAREDPRSPKLSAPLKELFSASLWGVTIPWNLVLSALIGLVMMLLPAFFQISDPFARNFYYILGPLIIVVSIVSLAELARGARWINLIFAIGIIVFDVVYGATFNILALLLALLSFRRGPIRERSRFE